MRALRILSGPPGAGKTTVARALARACDRGVHVHGDDFWRYIVSGFQKPWLPDAAEQNAIVMSAVASTAARFVDGGYATFVDGVVGPWLVEPFLSVARASDIELDYVVLRPSEQVAVRRAAARGRSGLMDEAVVRKMHREFMDLGDLERVVVDSSTLSPQATTREVLAGLSAKRFTVT